MTVGFCLYGQIVCASRLRPAGAAALLSYTISSGLHCLSSLFLKESFDSLGGLACIITRQDNTRH